MNTNNDKALLPSKAHAPITSAVGAFLAHLSSLVFIITAWLPVSSCLTRGCSGSDGIVWFYALLLWPFGVFGLFYAAKNVFFTKSDISDTNKSISFFVVFANGVIFFTFLKDTIGEVNFSKILFNSNMVPVYILVFLICALFIVLRYAKRSMEETSTKCHNIFRIINIIFKKTIVGATYLPTILFFGVILYSIYGNSEIIVSYNFPFNHSLHVTDILVGLLFLSPIGVIGYYQNMYRSGITQSNLELRTNKIIRCFYIGTLIFFLICLTLFLTN